MEKIARDEVLEEKYRDYSLSGNYEGARECHIEPDFLLTYEKNRGCFGFIFGKNGITF